MVLNLSIKKAMGYLLGEKNRQDFQFPGRKADRSKGEENSTCFGERRTQQPWKVSLRVVAKGEEVAVAGPAGRWSGRDA